MDGSNVSENAKPPTTTQTIYSTTAPMKIQYDETSTGSRSNTLNPSPTYSVTENVYEQSPYLPENENGETFLNILHANQDEAGQNDTDDNQNKLSILTDEENVEGDNETANLITESESKPKKTIQTQDKSFEDVNETTKIETPESTEIYELQESRTHNHDKIQSTEKDTTESYVSDHSGEDFDGTTTFARESISFATKLKPESQEEFNDELEMTTVQEEKKLISSKNSEIQSTNVQFKEPSSEPTSEPISEPIQPSSTENTIEIVTSISSNKTSMAQGNIEEITSTAEPVIAEDERTTTPPLNDASSETEIINETVTFRSAKSDDGDQNPTAEPSPVEATTVLPIEDEMKISVPITATEIPFNKMKEVTPEQTVENRTETKLKLLDSIDADPDDSKETSTNATENSDESTESTTGHFLSNATFRLIPESFETSLNSSDSNGLNKMLMNMDNDKENVMPSQTVSSSTEKSNYIYSHCTAGQFECKNGTSIKDGGSCISLSERCDSITHCTDASDELDCQSLGCPGHFQCNDGSCLARSHVCDKIRHCADGSDENENLCNDWKCKFDEISCDENGPCLPAILQCDGIQHCASQADETNCPDTCKSNEFYCSWQKKCIPETWLCDGKVDCSGGEDERSCDCSEGQFKCRTGRCVPDQYVCDGAPQCADHSDDWDCFNLTNVKYSTNGTGPNSNGIGAIEIEASALQVKWNGTYSFVCYEDWNLNFADQMCEHFGYARSKNYFAIEVNTTNLSVIKINNDFVRESILMNLIGTSSCNGNKIVGLECEVYECGNEITRDKEAASKVKAWPTAALAMNEHSGTRCTATILSPRWALASYSCIFGEFDSNGEIVDTHHWWLQVNPDDGTDETRSSIKRIHKYPQTKYKQFFYSGNVVLLELSVSLEFNENVTAACLTNEPIDQNSEPCITIGWLLSPGTEQDSDIKKLNQSILSSNDCNSTSNYAGSLPDDTICIENNNNGTNNTNCITNDGASLMCYSSTKSSWQLKGMLSYQNDCQWHTLPLLYTKITDSLLEWITKTIGNNRNRLNGS